MKDANEEEDFINAIKQCEEIATRWSRIKHHYGLTRKDYLKLLDTQNQRCAICGSKGKRDKRRKLPGCLYVDHDHKTGKTRGLLCQSCNTLLGSAKDNPVILASTIRYLRKHK